MVREFSSPLVLYFSIFINTRGAGVGKFMRSDIVGLMQVSAQGLKQTKNILGSCNMLFTPNFSFSPHIKKVERFSHRTENNYERLL